MARQQNYGFDKRRKEQERKAKKDAKIAERLQRRNERPTDEQADGSESTAAPDADTGSSTG